MKTTQQKLFITHSKLFQASLCDLQFGNLRPTFSIHKNHKEMDAILFLIKQVNPNIEKYHQHGTNAFTTIEVAGCHGEEAGCRDSSEQLCSVDHVHIR